MRKMCPTLTSGDPRHAALSYLRPVFERGFVAQVWVKPWPIYSRSNFREPSGEDQAKASCSVRSTLYGDAI